jgi:SprT-like family protein
MSRATNKMLQDWYNEFNSRFFEGRLPPDIEVRFATSEDDKDQLGNDCMGVYVHARKLILQDYGMREYWKMLKTNLLHEMVHALFPDHVSHKETEDHGMVFQYQIVKLFEKGAYDGLL